MTSSSEAPWQAISRRKVAERAALLPSQWGLPSSFSLPHDPPRLEDGPQNVLNSARQGLSHSEMEITESYTIPTLLEAITSKKLSTAQVVDAFCHRATIAQQLTNCLTEVLFKQAAERGKELDRYLKDNGKPFGPLHGLPITVKDTFNIKGVDSSVGIASLCFKPAQTNSTLVDLLLSLGCVIIAKTNIPQTLASLDSVNNVFGRTMNPVNRMCTAGGSSGGEGVIVAMKGSMIGIGTDIGGSIRIPAMCNGVYGFKPSEGRVPYGGQAELGVDGISRTSVQAIAGPIARSLEDIDFLMKEIVPRASMWGEDCVPGSWGLSKISGSGENGVFVIGVLRGDGNCALLPPIDKILTEVADKLRSSNVKVVELPTPKAWTRCQSVMRQLSGVNVGARLASLLEETKEPLVPWMRTRFRIGKPPTLHGVAEMQVQRAALMKEMISIWTEEDGKGRRQRKIDAIICPVAAHPVPPIEGYNAVGYTSSFNLLDYAAASMPIRPVKEADLELGRPLGGKVLGSWDEKNRELWDESKLDRNVYLGTPLSVQVVTPRLEDEKLIRVMAVIDRAWKNSATAGSRSKL